MTKIDPPSILYRKEYPLMLVYFCHLIKIIRYLLNCIDSNLYKLIFACVAEIGINIKHQMLIF